MADQVEEIKRKVDIQTIIGARVELKRAGKYLKGLCPFHGERTPSFFVSPELQVYKCFGCGESGDVFSFLEKYEGLSFREVLEDLAEKVGVTLESYRPSKQEEDGKRLYQVLDLAMEYFHFLLLKHPAGENARQYLDSRKITIAQVEQFYLGWAPDMWDGLTTYLSKKKGFSVDELEKAGMLIKSARAGRGIGGYDRFRGRIMFPLRDFRGRVVGFSGRVIDPEIKEAKYINTPETQLYRKRELLFGLDQAKPAIRKRDRVIIVEGEFDVISSFSAGVRNVVAIKGSALTDEQIKLLMRLTKRVVLCLDADAAGDEAMKRGIDTADKLGVEVEVIRVKGGKDVDDLARTQPKEWKVMSKQTVSVFQFLIDSIFEKHDVSTGIGKKRITEALTPVLDRISNKVEQAHYIHSASRRLGVSEETLLAEMQRKLKKQQLGIKETQEDKNPVVSATTRGELLEKYVWSLWLQLEGSIFLAELAKLNEVHWIHPGLKRLFALVGAYVETGQGFALREFVQTLPAELQGVIQDLYLDKAVQGPVGQDQVVKELGLALQALVVQSRRERLKELSADISVMEQKPVLSTAEEKALEKMQSEFAKLSVLLVG